MRGKVRTLARGACSNSQYGPPVAFQIGIGIDIGIEWGCFL